MTVHDIIKTYLDKHGFDGLVGGGICSEGCGCLKDDLCPCLGLELDGNPLQCEPGYRVPADEKTRHEYEANWMMSTTKPTPPERAEERTEP